MSEDDRRLIFRSRSGIVEGCNCGWEIRFYYGVAYTLAVFEGKRLLVIALEILAEWQVIRFAGGSQPVALTLAGMTLGLPCALITVRTIRRRVCDGELPILCPKSKRWLRWLLLMISVCAAINTATLASIGYHISVRQETLAAVFNASMQLYVSAASYKYAIDEIQFVLQCCGHTSYTDWFLFDWQKVDYASREEMAAQSRISDEDYRDRGVPFSCCSLRATAPCVHTEMTDDGTINVNGCAGVISPILLRIVVVAYVMTGTLIVMQVLLAFLIARTIRQLPPSRTSIPLARRATAPFTIINTAPRIYVSRFSSIKKSAWHKRRNVHSSSAVDACVKENRKVRSPTATRHSCRISKRGNCNTWEVARIKPSVHVEHRISLEYGKRAH